MLFINYSTGEIKNRYSIPYYVDFIELLPDKTLIYKFGGVTAIYNAYTGVKIRDFTFQEEMKNMSHIIAVTDPKVLVTWSDKQIIVWE